MNSVAQIHELKQTLHIKQGKILDSVKIVASILVLYFDRESILIL